MAASSFDGTNIRVELDPATASGPTWEKTGYTTTRHIPGGNDDVIQVMGYGHGVITVRIMVNAAEWSELQPKLLTEGNLIIAGIAQGTCLLEALSAPQRHVDGWVTVTATFRRTVAD